MVFSFEPSTRNSFRARPSADHRCAHRVPSRGCSHGPWWATSPSLAPKPTRRRDETAPRLRSLSIGPTSGCGLSRTSYPPRSTAEHAHRAGLDSDRVDDSVLVVGELAANSVHRGGGAGLVRTWIEADHFVCEVHDAGRLNDPLAGRRPADGQQLSGRGLLVVNHLTDLVRMHTQPAGTTIRAYFQLVVPKTRFTSVDLRPRAGGRPA
jgi:anti-sigma regulatory factor (Ser/Thr protein kinase)